MPERGEKLCNCEDQQQTCEVLSLQQLTCSFYLPESLWAFLQLRRRPQGSRHWFQLCLFVWCSFSLLCLAASIRDVPFFCLLLFSLFVVCSGCVCVCPLFLPFPFTYGGADLAGPTLCCLPCCLRFASFSVAILMMTYKMSSCTSFLRAGSDPTSLWVFVWFWFCCGFCVFCCLFALCLLVFSFDGTAHWTVYWSITALLRLSTCRRPCIIHNSSFCCS